MRRSWLSMIGVSLMPITDKQRELRRHHIGSSDAPAICGLDPFKSAYDVWLEKMGKLVDFDGSSEAAEIGNMVEAPLLDWAADTLKVKIKKNQRRVAGLLAANHDALIVNAAEGMEAKSSGLVSGQTHEHWGEAGTDEVPDRVIIQTAHQMLVSDLETVWVPALLPYRGRVLFRVDRENGLLGALEERLHGFWERHVLTGNPPEDSKPSLEVLKRVRREPKSIVTIDGSLLAAFREAKEIASAAAKARDEAQSALLAALGDAEAGECELGTVTYLEQTRKAYEVKESTYRVLRIKENKETGYES